MPSPPSPLTPEQTAAIQRAIDKSLAPINLRLDRGAEKMDAQGDAICAMRAELAANTATTNEVRELLNVGKSGLKVLGWLGAAGKWLGTLATAGVAIYAFLYALGHGGQLPPK
ncbi:MAG: hypothetical protein SHS37scaffold296_15 [Burkholderiales phage 68_11]|jgi:hypothetical protein|nr:MAG: hypothetical protein SHS37scaffold296_15 [Burkholderiales phage 68_11]